MYILFKLNFTHFLKMNNSEHKNTKLIEVAKLITKLKELLKCPLCFKLTQNVIELECSHRFCNSCYNELKEQNLNHIRCPICLCTIKRRHTLYKDEYADLVSNFLLDISNQIHTVCKQKVEEVTLPSASRILQHFSTDLNLVESNSKVTGNVPEQKNSVKKSFTHVPKKQKCSSKGTKSKLPNKNITPLSQCDSQQDPFDKLLNFKPLKVNKAGTKHNYSYKEKVSKENLQYNVLDFDDDKNRLAVLHWLNDTRNKFDRLTQTQGLLLEDNEEHNAVNMDSVSQCRKRQNVTISAKMYKKHRSKSLDIEIKSVKKPKRYSDRVGKILDNYNIEDPNTEEMSEEKVLEIAKNVFLHVLEDTYLNELDNEVLAPIANLPTKSNSKLDNTTTTHSTHPNSGWDRMSEIKKTTDRGGRAPKQLDIKFQSSEKQLVNKPSAKSTAVNAVEDKTIAKMPNVTAGVIEKVKEADAQNQTYNLKTIEDYISNNISKVVIKSLDCSSTSTLVDDTTHDIKNKLKGSDKSTDIERKLEKINEANKSIQENKHNPETMHITNCEDASKVVLSKKNFKGFPNSGNIIQKPTCKCNLVGDPLNSLEADKFEDMHVVEERMKRNYMSYKALSSPVQRSNKNYLLESKIHGSSACDVENLTTESYVEHEILTSQPKQSTAKCNSKEDIMKSHTDTSKDMYEVEETTNMMSAPQPEQFTAEVNVIDDLLNSHVADQPVCEDEVGIGQSIMKSKYAQDLSSTSKHDENHNPDGNLLLEKPAEPEDDVVEQGLYVQPTQKLANDDENYFALNQVLDNFCTPTQKLPFENDCQSMLQSSGEIFSFIHASISKCLKESMCPALDAELMKIKSYIDCLQQIKSENHKVSNTSDVSAGENLDTFNVYVQTDKVITKAEVTQTSHQIDKYVQTVVVAKKVGIAQTYLNMKEKYVQTDGPGSDKCIQVQVKEETPKISQNTENALRSILQEKFETGEASQKNDFGNHILTNTWDNIEFNTLEIMKNSALQDINGENVNLKRTQNNPTNTAKKEDRVVEVKAGPSKGKLASQNKLGMSNSLLKEVSKLCFESTNDTKRLREDDNEMEEVIRSKRKCNRFIRDDLSVEFDNSLNKDSQKSDNYDNYLAEIMKKYDDGRLLCNLEDRNSECSSTKKNPKNLTDLSQTDSRKSEQKVLASQSSKKSSPISNRKRRKYLDEYDEIIAKVNENVERLTKQAQITNVINEENQHLNSEVTKNNLDCSISASRLEAFKQQFLGYSADIVSETETHEAVPTKRYKVNLNEASKLEHNNGQTKEHLEECRELNDSFDEEQFVNIDFGNAEEMGKRSKSVINIIANVKIKSQNVKEKPTDEDLFSEDEDIVQTTPQKIINRPQKIESPNPDVFEDDDLEGIENLDSDITVLPPPPGFQDSPAAEVDDDETMKPNETILKSPVQDHGHSMTPDLLEFDEDITILNRNEKVDNHEESGREIPKRNMAHSTPRSQKGVTQNSLAFSPIANEIHSVSQASFNSNGWVKKGTSTSKSNILTSIPGQKSMWNYVKPSDLRDTTENDATPKKPCIACTRLNKDQIMHITQLTNRKLATYTTTFEKTVTHMIVSVDEKGCLKEYTAKFMAAVAAGIWVLRFEWVQDCLKKNAIVPEEPYEALDDVGDTGPRTSRLTRLTKPLFANFTFYCLKPTSTTVQDIKDVIENLGGTVVSRLELLKDFPHSIRLIIAEGISTQDMVTYERWLEQYKVVTVDIEWLSKSVGRYKLISIRPYIWCSDNNLERLGYPDCLIEDVPLFSMD